MAQPVENGVKTLRRVSVLWAMAEPPYAPAHRCPALYAASFLHQIPLAQHARGPLWHCGRTVDPWIHSYTKQTRLHAILGSAFRLERLDDSAYWQVSASLLANLEDTQRATSELRRAQSAPVCRALGCRHITRVGTGLDTEHSR